MDMAKKEIHWRKAYGGMSVNEARPLKQLEQENAWLKRLLAVRLLEVDALKDLLAKKLDPKRGMTETRGSAMLLGSITD
jgi:hypothetical protein